LLDNILFSTFYTGLFLLFREKTGGARAPPAPPLASALLMTPFIKVELLISYLIQSGQISKAFLPLWVVEQLRI